MKKKEIEKIPFTGSIKAKKQYLYTVSAFAREIKEERHLFVEIYENRKTPFPWVRMVFTEKDWILHYPGYVVQLQLDSGIYTSPGYAKLWLMLHGAE